jgi:type VII secretion protein EccB
LTVLQTQRDHVTAQKFVATRLTSALVFGDPTKMVVPAQRGRTGLVIGAVLALLVGVGLWIYGLVAPGGNTAWQQQGSILVEKETGTRYVFAGGELHATPNQASALLLAGQNAKVDLISRNSLAGLPHGAAEGIGGAPDPVPASDRLVSGPWLTCLSGQDTAPATGAHDMVVRLGGGVRTSAVPPNEYVVMTLDAGTTYVVLRGVKYPVRGRAAAAALGFATIRPVPASATWLAMLPNGSAIGPPAIADEGTPGPAVGGRHYPVGQLFQQDAANGDQEHFVLRADGLAPVSATVFALLAAAPGESTPAAVSPSAIGSAQLSADSSLLHLLPDLLDDTPTTFGSQQLCVRQQAAGQTISSSLVFGVDTAGASGNRPVEVSMPPGSGMVVVPESDGANPTTEYLITDQGLAFPMVGSDSVQALGFAGTTPVTMPDALIAALPTGPVLSRAAATHTPEG